jgi:phosphinothricin acetyltransferase
MSLHIRPARESDAARLAEIYNPYVLETAITFEVEPVDEANRRAWIAQHADTGRWRLLVAEEAGRVVGWANSRRFHERKAYEPTIETGIYLEAAAHGGGIGSALYRALFDALAGEDVHRVIASITLPNDASLALHRRFGFREVGVLSEVGRKFDRWWDVLWMERRSR